MRHIVAFSGGKDSQAVLLWAKASKLENLSAVFCDTGHEAPQTYEHIEYCCKALDVPLDVVRGPHDFKGLVEKKKRFPSIKARFCTEYLKIMPMVDFILNIKEDVVIYQGIRWEESASRKAMNEKDEYFAPYINGVKYAKYRKKAVLAHVEKYVVDVCRPVISWTANEVMRYIKDSGMVPNPLYMAGMKRVGCFPCVLCNQGDIKQMIDRFPERIQYIREMEKEMGRTFFPPDYIPSRFCTHPSGAPTIDDVVKYLGHAQPSLFDAPACMSHYNICE